MLFGNGEKPDDEVRQEPEGTPALNIAKSHLAQFSYRLAYYVLPQLLFGNTERILSYFTGEHGGPFLYIMGAKLLQVEPVREEALLFETLTGALSSEESYYVLRYPTPPPFDLNGQDRVLAPYFSAIVREDQTEQVHYFTLGQNPVQGTTLRSVLPDGANCNLGPGPAPELDDFLQNLRERRQNS